MADGIKICSLNCQGLADDQKRRDLFSYIRRLNFSIICLQDTHFSKEKERIILNEWGYKVYFSSYASNSRGVAILFNNNFEFVVHNSFSDNDGNLLILDIEIESTRLLLITLYGPNKDNPAFYLNLINLISDFTNLNIIIVGDWNIILNQEIDSKNYKHINNPRARQQVLRLMNNYNLYDVWREENPEKRIFTWKRKLNDNTVQMGRLDYFLVSENLIRFTSEENICPGYRTDHSLVSIKICFTEKEKRGRTYWKFNNSLLSNTDFITEVKKAFLKIKEQYAVFPYNRDNIKEIEPEFFETLINPQLFLEIILLEVRSVTIAFSSALKKRDNDRERELTDLISKHENSTSIEDLDYVTELKDELKEIRGKRLQGTLIRSRARWVEEGEKASRYFCNLENRNFVSKRMSSLINEKGEEIKDPTLIRHEVYKFYSFLYRSREDQIENIDLDMRLDDDTPKLSDIEAFGIEGEITLDEATRTLKNMQNNKSPGSSGFSTEFFKFFWIDIGHFVVKSINHSFRIGELSTTQKEGIITCVPKGSKSKKFIKNWRPISLLNISYKIASGCIAHRIKKILPLIIDLDQSGFMSERFVGDNIRLIYDLLNYSKNFKKRGLLLLIDFEKAFDSVSWSFIDKCLSYFNFKEDIKSWIKLFYKNIKSTVIVNNKPTLWFKIERGCRQGDPISPYIFLICSEILAHMIRQNKEIKGFTIFDNEVKISQYADDTSLFMDGTQNCFEICIQTILEYAKYSGLSMNFDKTKVIWFGLNNEPPEIYMPHLNFEWNPVKFKILGIEFTTDLRNITENNLQIKIPEMQRELDSWSKRDITPFGKITVIKSLVLSKIVHILIALPSPNINIFKKINDMLYEFLWDGKPDKIKRDVIKLKLESGGLGMIDIILFDKSLKLTWLRRLIRGKSKWKDLICTQYPKLKTILYFGDQFARDLSCEVKNIFWRDILSYFYEFYGKFELSTIEDLKASSFLFNKQFKVGGMVISSKILIENNIFFISQLMNEESFMTFEQFTQKYNIQMNFLTYYSIIQSIQKASKIDTLEETGELIKYQRPINVILKSKKGSSDIYTAFLSSTNKSKGKDKWKLLCNIDEDEWIGCFSFLKYSIKDTKLRWLQFRILHYILTTNRSVSKYKENQTELCTFCNEHSETIQHLFWHCHIVRNFWNGLAHLISTRCKHAERLVFREKLVLFGQEDFMYTDQVCNLIIIMAKLHIYRCKVQGSYPHIKNFIKELYQRYCLEKVIIKDPIKFKNVWEPYDALFKSLL